MLIIANAYRRCNMWNANCGASFEWVGRAIDPYLGFLTGWLMVVAYIIGTVAEILLLGPSVLAVFGSTSTNTWAWIAIGSGLALVMLVIAVVGIRITAQTQVGMALVEYLILVGLAVAGLVAVLGHQAGTYAVTRGWLSLSGIERQGQRGRGLPHRGLRLRRLGRRHVRQRGGQAAPHQPRPGGHSSPSACSRSSTRWPRWACRAWCRRPGCRPTRPPRWSTWPRRWAAGSGPR